MEPVRLCAAGDTETLGWWDPWAKSQGDRASGWPFHVTCRLPQPFADLFHWGKTQSFEVSREVSPGVLAVSGELEKNHRILWSCVICEDANIHVTDLLQEVEPTACTHQLQQWQPLPVSSMTPQ